MKDNREIYDNNNADITRKTSVKMEKYAIFRFVELWKIFYSVSILLLGIFLLYLGFINSSMPFFFFLFLICLFLAVFPFVSCWRYIRTPAKKLWSRWEGVSGKPAETRKQRAASEQLTSVRIDTNLHYGIYAGAKGGRYRTTLSQCSCPDFMEREVPCKHMYHLAWKCGLEKL